MVSPLESFIGAQQAGQGIVKGRQDIARERLNQQQRLQAAPIAQRQAEIGLSDQEIGLAVQRAQLLSNAIDAVGRASQDPQERLSIAQGLIPELQQFGIEIDPADVTIENLTDDGLAALKAETTGFIQDPQTAISNIQQAVAIPGVGFQTLTREGEVGLRTLDPEQQAQISQAFETEAQRKARAAGLKSGATETGKILAKESTETGQTGLQKARTDVAIAESKLAEEQQRIDKGNDIKSKALQLVQELLQDREATLANFGRIDQFRPDAAKSDNAVDAGKKLQQLEDILTSDNLGLMTGVLSETDLQIIRNISAGGLNRGLSDAQALQNLRELEEKFSGQLGVESSAGLPEGVTEEDITFTMEKHGLTREQVLQAIGAQ